MKIGLGISYAVLVVCLTTSQASADNSQATPAPAAPAPQKEMPNLSKTIYSPGKVDAANKSAAASPADASQNNNNSPELTPAEDLPGASQDTKLPTDNPMEELDPDGVPLSLSENQPEKPTQAMIDAYLKQRTEAEESKDWLVRSYEKQVEARRARENDQTPDLFLELSSNKELARLAGLPVTDDTQEGSSFRTDDAAQADKSADLRKDSDTNETEASKLTKPFISLASPAAAISISAPLPFALDPSIDNAAPAISSPAKPDDTADLDTPGAVAAKNGGDPLADSSSTDLNLDMLPGESVEQARARQDADSPAELALPMDTAQLHKQEAATMEGPQLAQPVAENKTTDVAPPGPPAPNPSEPKYDPNAPVPVSQVAPPSTRPPIANPFDILNR